MLTATAPAAVQPRAAAGAHAAQAAQAALGALRPRLADAPAAGRAAPELADDHPLLDQVLNLMDYGLVLLAADGRVRQINHAAQRELAADDHPLHLQGDRLQAHANADAAALREAVAAAGQRGLRRMLLLGHGDARCSVAVVPLAARPGVAGRQVALLLSRRRVCEQLTVEWFARAHGLTLAETTVVKGLCANLTAQQIAEQQGVGLATVRTQIGAVRLKTGASSIPALLRQVSLLPPLMNALH